MSETPLRAQMMRDREAASQISESDRARYERQLKSAVDRSSFYRFAPEGVVRRAS